MATLKLKKFERFLIKGEDKLFFIEHLSLLVRAGIDISKAIEILSEQTTNKTWHRVLVDVRDSLAKGNSFPQSLGMHPDVFDVSLRNMTNIGELRGDMPAVLDTYATLQRKNEEVRRKIQSAMLYPIIVLVAMVLLAIGVVTYLIPQLASVFSELDIALPLPTRILIGTSNLLVNHGLLVFPVMLMLVAGFVVFVRLPRGRFLFDSFVLRIPIIGKLIKEHTLEQLARNLSVLLTSAVPIDDAFKTTASVVANSRFRESLETVVEEIGKGNRVYTALKHYPDLYSNLIVQIIEVGEEAAVLDEVLMKMAAFYERRVNAATQDMTAVLEPLLIIVLGGGVVFMALAILSPIYSIAQAI